MDNIAHALTGAALGQAGLKRLTGLAMPALILSSNISDIDAIAMLMEGGLGIRRGWTHGPFALIVLPALLAALLLAIDRWQMSKGKRPAGRLPVHFWTLLLLCWIGAVSHVLLDLLNTYGVRLLMPLSERWFYGDTLFIIDPWLWLSLVLGYWLAHRRERSNKPNFARPAIGALLCAALYVGAMYMGGRAAERFVIGELNASGYGDPDAVLASPVPANPFRRDILVKYGDTYRFGDLRLTPLPRFIMEPETISTNMSDPAIARARAENNRFAAFLYWSRYPFAAIERSQCGTRVTINDGRYARSTDSGPFSTTVLLAEDTATRPECHDGQ